MKFLKYFFGIIAVLIIGFFLIGFIKPELTYNCEVEVNKSLKESWAVSQDEDKMANWLEGFQKIVPISGTQGKEGAVADIYFITDGQEMVIRETITKIVPDKSVSMLFTSEFMDMDYTLIMESNNQKTIIKSSSTCKGNGTISKSIIALMGSSIKAQEEKNLSNLKKTIEVNKIEY